MNTSLKKVYGPPGTGKTTWLIEHMRNSGVPFSRIAFVSFSNAAIYNVLSRLDLNDTDRQYFRTVHGLCFKMLNLRKESTAHKHLHTFPAKFSAEFLQKEAKRNIEDANNNSVAHDTIDDSFYYQMMEDRNNLMPIDFVPRHLMRHAGLYISFKRRYKQWLDDNNLVDFVGMLEQAYDARKIPPVDLLCVDEWQDLTPLQVRLVTLWSQNIPRSVHAGDDDQTIHEWAGARSEDFLNFPTFEPTEKETIILNRTFRLPPSVLDMSIRFIKKNRRRVDKNFSSEKKDEGIIDYTHIDKVAEVLKEQLRKGSCKVLIRNNALRPKIMKDLADRGVPVSGNEGLRNTVKSIAMIKNQKKRLSIEDLYFLAKPNNTVFPARKFYTHGGKKNLKAIADTLATDGRESIAVEDLTQFKVKDTFILAFQNGDISDLQTTYIEEALKIYEVFGESYNPVEISSIHAAKGTEADTVVVCLDVTKRTYLSTKDVNKIEEERRVWYVAMTRTRKNLLFLRPTYQYFYPALVTDYIKLYLQNEQN